MQEILSGNLTLSHAQRSVFFKQMEPRLKPLAHLEEFLDSNEIVFRYKFQGTCFFSDSADYLLQNSFRGYTGILISGTAYGRGHAGMPYLFPKIGKGLCRGSAALYLAEKRKTQSTDRRHYHPIR